MTGWLIDARFGVTAAAEAQQEQLASEFVSEAAGSSTPGAAGAPRQDTSDSAGADGTADGTFADGATAGDDPAGRMPVRAVRAVLVGDRGVTLVIGQTESGLSGWLYTGDHERTLPHVTLTEAAGADRESWTLEAAGTDPLAGQLTVMDEDPMPVAPRIVRGVVNVGDDRLEMHGVVRPAAP